MANYAVGSAISTFGTVALVLTEHKTGVDPFIPIGTGIVAASNTISAIHAGLQFNRLTKAPKNTEDAGEGPIEHTESNPMTQSNIDDLPTYINHRS